MILKLKLPDLTKLLVKKDQKLSIGDPFYTIDSDDNTTVPVSSRLGINPHNIFHVMKVVVGDSVETETILAEKKGLFGKKKITSPIKGTIKHINHETGNVEIAAKTGSADTVSSFIDATVSEFDPDSNIIHLEISNGLEIPLTEVSENSGGKLFVFKDDSDYFTINEDAIKDAIIVIDELRSHIETKLEALSAKGYVYVTSSTSINIPHAQLGSNDSIEKLIKSTHTHIVFSFHEKKAVAYTIID